MSHEQAYQIEELRTTVAELRASVKAKDAEIRNLQELADAAQDMHLGDAQAAKIIDLSKKNRALLLSLEKEKQRSMDLQILLKTSPSAAQAPQAPPDPEGVEERARAFVEKAVEAAEAAARDATVWKEKHQQQTNKMAQLEQKVFSLEIEHKKVVRALVREVGEEIPIAKVLDDGSDWKGRREQLIALRDQVKALKAAQGLAKEGRHEVATKNNISKISGQRSAEMDRLAAEAASTKQELEALRSKHEAAIARRKVLEAEMSSMKEKVAVVLKKSVNDSKLISALRAEIQAPTGHRGSKSGHPDLINESELWKELGQLRRKLSAQEEQNRRQEQIILMLQGGSQQDEMSPAASLQQSPPSTAPQQPTSSRQGSLPHTPQTAVSNTASQRSTPPARDPTKLSKLGESEDWD